jgi:hypothetical protein
MSSKQSDSATARLVLNPEAMERVSSSAKTFSARCSVADQLASDSVCQSAAAARKKKPLCGDQRPRSLLAGQRRTSGGQKTRTLRGGPGTTAICELLQDVLVHFASPTTDDDELRRHVYEPQEARSDAPCPPVRAVRTKRLAGMNERFFP